MPGFSGSSDHEIQMITGSRTDLNDSCCRLTAFSFVPVRRFTKEKNLVSVRVGGSLLG